MKFCSATGKVRYDSRETAARARWRKASRLRDGRLRTYRCEECGDWHLAGDQSIKHRRKAVKR